MAATVIDFTTPVGRLVEGSVYEGVKTDLSGRPLVVKSGANAGQPRTDYYFALAIRKDDPAWPELYSKIYAEARNSFPSLFNAQGQCIRQDFAWKIVDGDSQQINQNNVRPCDKEGFPGHMVLRFSSGFAPKCYDEEARLIPENEVVNRIRRGYFVRVYGTVKGNGDAQKPGIFLNHSMVQFCGYGDEIKSGPSGEQVFGAQPIYKLPPGASATPPTPQNIAPPAQPHTAAPAIPQFGAPAPTNVQPNYDFLNGPQQETVTPAAPPAAAPSIPAAPAVVKYVLNGVAYSEVDLRAAGYTDAHFATMQKA